jgi:hypothetical protein
MMSWMGRTVTVSSRYVSQPENVVVGAGEKSKYIIRVTCSDHCMDHKQRFVHDLVPFSARGLIKLGYTPQSTDPSTATQARHRYLAGIHLLNRSQQ